MAAAAAIGGVATFIETASVAQIEAHVANARPVATKLRCTTARVAVFTMQRIGLQVDARGPAQIEAARASGRANAEIAHLVGLAGIATVAAVCRVGQLVDAVRTTRDGSVRASD